MVMGESFRECYELCVVVEWSTACVCKNSTRAVGWIGWVHYKSQYWNEVRGVGQQQCADESDIGRASE
jgi:hypothetical protein